MVEVSAPFVTEDALSVFSDLLPYVNRIKDRAQGIDPALLRQELADGLLTLHAVGDEGYIIASWSSDEMFVVSAAAFDLSCDLPILINATMRFAKKHNCAKLSFRSNRPAWGKVALANGFAKDGNYFTKELTNG